MAAAEEKLRRAGCRTAELTVVNLRLGLIPTYEKMGYQSVGIEEPSEELRIKLTMPVKLVVMQKPLAGE